MIHRLEYINPWVSMATPQRIPNRWPDVAGRTFGLGETSSVETLQGDAC